MQHLSASVLSIALLCMPLAASAQVYTWTDAHGTVHYADTPPAHGAQYKGRNMPGATVAPAHRAHGSDDADATDTGAPEPGPDDPASSASPCDTLKANMKLLTQEGPVIMRDENGKSQLLSKDARATQLARIKKKSQTYCKP